MPSGVRCFGGVWCAEVRRLLDATLKLFVPGCRNESQKVFERRKHEHHNTERSTKLRIPVVDTEDTCDPFDYIP